MAEPLIGMQKLAPQTFGAAVLRAIALALACLVALSGDAQPQPAPPTQYDVEAVYLYNFAKFVRWPLGTQRDAMTVCVAGQKVYSDTLTRIVAGERIDERPLSVRSVERPEEMAGCDILFIGLSAKNRLDSLLAPTANKPILTVSDIPGFLDKGGMIQFVVSDSRVRFAVDLRPVQGSGISLSSELLKVAVKVSGNPPGGPA